MNSDGDKPSNQEKLPEVTHLPVEGNSSSSDVSTESSQSGNLFDLAGSSSGDVTQKITLLSSPANVPLINATTATPLSIDSPPRILPPITVLPPGGQSRNTNLISSPANVPLVNSTKTSPARNQALTTGGLLGMQIPTSSRKKCQNQFKRRRLILSEEDDQEEEMNTKEEELLFNQCKLWRSILVSEEEEHDNEPTVGMNPLYSSTAPPRRQ